MSFWCHFDVILGIILAHFGVILGHFGDLWATLGHFGPPGRRDLIWDPLLEHFEVTFGTPWGPLGRPLGTPREQEGAQRLSQEGSREGSKTRPQKGPHFGTSWKVKMELSPAREHRFQDFRGVPFGSHFGSILEPFWTPRAPLFSPRGARRGKKGVRKGV